MMVLPGPPLTLGMSTNSSLSPSGATLTPPPSRGKLGGGWDSTPEVLTKSFLLAGHNLPHPHPHPPLEGEGIFKLALMPPRRGRVRVRGALRLR